VPSPRVSICIPVYNTERFILDAVTSVLAQTYRDFELVIVDNASTDATPGILSRITDPRVRTFRNDENVGAQANFNRAVSLARGEYLKILCADDVLYPTCVEKQVAVLDADTRGEVALVSCARDIIDDRGRRRLRRGHSGPARRIPGRRAIRMTVRSGTNVFGEPAAILARTAAVIAAGSFDVSLGFCLDLDLWCRMLLRGDLHMLGEALCGFRVSNQSWSAALAGRQQREFSEFVDSLAGRGVALSALDRAWGRSRASVNALLRQAVTRMLLLTART
jgi:glycosyltransferase involved in cell wall biosynthesis